MKKTKKTLAALLSATLALSLGVGIWHFKPEVRPSAEEDEIESVQRIVGSLPEISLDAEVQDITISAGSSIDAEIMSMQTYNIGSPVEGTASVAARDWTVYDDEYGLSKMSDGERAFYRRLEAASVQYISDSTLDAYPMERYNIYVTEGVSYDDLGLSKQQAIGLTQWFIYNNPQYYFYQTRFLVSDVSIYMGCYPIFVDGDDRANVTNQIFRTVDAWVASINDDEITTYQKVLSAHDLLCNELSYVSGDYDQSIYSTVMQKKTVCAGYAGMFNIMLNASGIHSTVGISSTHAWNLVKMDDGIYYGVDSTWDDTLGSHKLFAVGGTDLKKYDRKGTEHVYVYPWTEFAPGVASSNYVPSYYDENGREETTPAAITVCDPYGFTSKINGTSATVNWKCDDATGYQYSVSSKSGTITRAGLSFSDLTPGHSYTVYITAYKVVNGTTYYSNAVPYTFTIPNTTVTVSLTKPVLSSSKITSSKYKVSWDKVTNAGFYQYAISNASDFSKIISSNDSYRGKYINLTNMTEGVPYYVRVRAGVTRSGKTTYSDWAYITVTRPVTTTQPAATQPTNTTNTNNSNNTSTATASVKAPTNLTFTKRTTSIYKLGWDKVSGAKKYEYITATDSGFTNVLSSGTTSSVSATVSGLRNVSTVYVKVRTVTNDGTSDWTVKTFTK